MNLRKYEAEATTGTIMLSAMMIWGREGGYDLIHNICIFYGLHNKTFNGSDHAASNYGMCL
jgi:hypothetical protein